VFYSTGQFVLATKYFDRVSPDSYDWPNSLFESSWANFMLKQAGYSKALGNIHTLRAPFFEYFIKPESAAEALTVKATIYFYNCLFDRASDAMNEFDETVPEIRKGLDEMLRSTRTTPTSSTPRSRSAWGARARSPSSSVPPAPCLRIEALQAVRVRTRARQGAGRARQGRCRLEVDRRANKHLFRSRREPSLMVNEAGEMARKRVARLVE